MLILMLYAIPICIPASGVLAQPVQPTTTTDNSALTLLIGAGALIFLQAFFKDLTSIVNTSAASFPKWLEEKQKERMAKTDALQNVVEQNEKLFAEIGKRDDRLVQVTNALLESQRLNHELRQQNAEDRKQFKQDRDEDREELRKMLEQGKAKDAAMEALAKENATLKDDNLKLKVEAASLKEELEALRQEVERLRNQSIIPVSTEDHSPNST